MKKIFIISGLIFINFQMHGSTVSVASLQPLVNKLQNDCMALQALMAGTVSVPSSNLTGMIFYIQFTDAQNKAIWTMNYISAGSLACINQALQSEGGVYIVMNPISKMTNWRVSYSVYGAKTLTFVDAQSFDLHFESSKAPVPVAQVKNLQYLGIQYQLEVNGKYAQLPVVAINQPTLLKVGS